MLGFRNMQEKLEKMLFNRNLSTFLKIDLTELHGEYGQKFCGRDILSR